MKVLAITGSPREQSNTEFYLKQTLEEIEKHGLQTELIKLNEKSIHPCKGCYCCVEARECVYKGDDFAEVFDKMLEADGILLGSPVYHSAITPYMKALLDRAGFSGRWAANKTEYKNQDYNWSGTAFSGKVGAPFTVARRSGQSFAFAELLLWFTVNDFIVTGSTYWNVGVAGKGGALDAQNDLEGISIVKHLAGNMAHVIKQLKK